MGTLLQLFAQVQCLGSRMGCQRFDTAPPKFAINLDQQKNIVDLLQHSLLRFQLVLFPFTI